MKTIQEQIDALYAAKADASEAMNAEVNKGLSEDRGMNDEEIAAFDAKQNEIASIDENIKRLEQVKSMQATATPVKSAVITGGAPVVDNVQGAGFARVVKCFAAAKGQLGTAIELAKISGDERVVNVMKAAVAAGSVSSATWAGNLVGAESKVFADFAEYLRPMTILGKMSLRTVPFRTALLGQSSGGEAYWTGENAPKGVTKFDFTRTTITPLKVAAISVLTDELVRDSSPAADVLVRDSLAQALAARLDVDFIDPAKGASAGVSPASILNGIAAISSAGNTAADVREDVKAIFSAFINANNAPTSGVWVMPQTIALALSLMQNALGQPEFPTVNMMGGTLYGLPVIASQYMPTVSAGSYVALVNQSDIYYADEGGVSIDMSNEASLQLDDAPSAGAQALVSLWQNNLVAIRAERTLNYARRRASAVAYLSGVNYGS